MAMYQAPFAVDPSKQLRHPDAHVDNTWHFSDLHCRHLKPRPEAKIAVMTLLDRFKTGRPIGMKGLGIHAIAGGDIVCTDHGVSPGTVEAGGAAMRDKRIELAAITANVSFGGLLAGDQKIVERRIWHLALLSVLGMPPLFSRDTLIQLYKFKST
jgi:hypothetical protein